MTITDVFTQFDIIDKKGFDTHEIVGTLSSVEENEKGKPEFCFENLALSLVPSHDDNWGTYYGPQAILKDSNNNPIEVPALNDVTIDAVLY